MSNQVKSAIGVSGTALFVVLATNAKPLFEGLQAGWTFVYNISSQAALGISSFILSLVLSTSIMWFLVKWIPESITEYGKHGQSFLIELIVLGIGIFAVYFQMPNMLGLMVGTVAGLMAPLCYRAMAGMVAWIVYMFSNKVDPNDSSGSS